MAVERQRVRRLVSDDPVESDWAHHHFNFGQPLLSLLTLRSWTCQSATAIDAPSGRKELYDARPDIAVALAIRVGDRVAYPAAHLHSGARVIHRFAGGTQFRYPA